jgi:hypothetical protein
MMKKTSIILFGLREVTSLHRMWHMMSMNRKLDVGRGVTYHQLPPPANFFTNSQILYHSTRKYALRGGEGILWHLIGIGQKVATRKGDFLSFWVRIKY